MRFFLKTLILFAVFVAVAGTSGYLTLRFIIKGEDTVVVPDLVGKDVIYVLNILTDLGLNTKVDGFEYQGRVPKNHVAYQDPASGSVIKKDRDVRIIISKGPRSFVVPNLVGMDIRQAYIIMEENGLSEGVMSRTFSPSAAEDEVMSHEPAAGTVAVRGDSMDLLVSLGTRPIAHKMPHLEGMTLEDAIMVLERYQLGTGQVRSELRKGVPLDTVVAQDPLYGHQVISGGPVNLTINRAETGPILEKGLSVLHYPVPGGFLKSHVRIRVNAYGMFYELYDDFARPGEEIWCLTPPDPKSKVFVYENGKLVPRDSSGGRY
jgi:serine/threonine-protein kinase